ncbi:LSU ribosomal protein L21p [Flavivirga aquatica]|uniref:LSU ribosomal protein L21p n=1 Tax=Flavivirga aquatica TaxID=1849968 RepID=A0A1E5TDV6_9FLAO|nr:hypothetical protein [Flavivirga aquatica]OEK09550.1 LSU ribosomal protein L21p [Flavivirga aquatica]
MNLCILIPLLVGVICAFLGYLLGKLLNSGNHNDCYAKIERLEAELEACKSSKTSLTSPLAASTSVPLIAFNADAAKAVFGKKIKENDLTIVEGIGPKIKELFHNHDVKTWKALSECSVEKCQNVLDSGGDRFKIHKPGTWSKQAQLAYEGKWEELLKWQDKLDRGK